MGSLMKEDRDAIFKGTGCSVATRDRGKGRCLSVAGPPDKLAKAREMALEACKKNREHFEQFGQSSNPGNANEAGDDRRVQEGYWRQKAHQLGASAGSWESWGGWEWEKVFLVLSRLVGFWFLFF